MKVFLGFDPGGKGKFGWAVCIHEVNKLKVLTAGTADHAKGAMEQALTVIPKGGFVAGVGIDAPMFWVTDGTREADRRILRAIALLGAPSPGGTVQHFNSLRGACVIQGLLILKLLRESFPTLPITEAHPKALLWLMRIARKGYEPIMVKPDDIKEVSIPDDIKEIIRKKEKDGSHDERDAILGAFTAQMMVKKKSGWEDLLKYERDPVLAEMPPIAYWMPRINITA